MNNPGALSAALTQGAIFLGVVIVSAVHVFHLQKLNHYVHSGGHVRRFKTGAGYALAPIVFAVLAISVLTALHVVNCVLWGVLAWGLGAFDNLPDAVFYAFENYTALGLTRVQSAWPWRFLAPAISFTGVLCFAWTGAILAGMFVRLYGASDEAVESQPSDKPSAGDLRASP